MNKFTGFKDDEPLTPLPSGFFQGLLRDIHELAELKVTLYLLWMTQDKDAPIHGLHAREFDSMALGLEADEIRRGLANAVRRGTVLGVRRGADEVFFLNSARGRASAESFEQGRGDSSPAASPADRPNIFKLYEENIGPLTPLIADALKDAEATYSEEWVRGAIELAVAHNKRSWKYCEGILKRWRADGRGQKPDRRDAQKDRDKYVKGEYADFVEH